MPIAEVIDVPQAQSGHDHGNAADLNLFRIGPDGKKQYLSQENGADRAIMERFMREAVRAGANGVGSGPGYMGGKGAMHIGGGSSMAWEAGGASANAPDWVRRAHAEGMEARRKDLQDAARE